MSEELIWSDEAADYIASRSSRYLDGLDVDPRWTQEAMSDLNLAALEPDPKSRMGAPDSSATPQAPDGYWL